VFDLKRGELIVVNGDPFLVPILPTVIRNPRAPPLLPITPRIVAEIKSSGSSNQLLFQVPLFIDLKIKLPGDGDNSNGNCNTINYRAWEFYDYHIDSTFPPNHRPSLSRTRNGSNPAFVEECGQGVMHFHGYRVDSFHELPESLQLLVNTEYELFRAPPLGLEDADRLLLEAKSKKVTII